MYEQPPSGRRVGLSLFLVLVVLAGVAGTGAYFVTRRILADQPQNPNGGRTSSPSTTGPSPIKTIIADPNDPATSCPKITEDAVRDAGLGGELQLLRYVDGAGDGYADAEAWICKDTNGVLIYQGHRKTGPFDAANSNDTILLGRGIRGKVEARGDEFVATNPKDPTNIDDPTHTDYHVSAVAFFFVDSPGDRRTDYKVIRTVP